MKNKKKLSQISLALGLLCFGITFYTYFYKEKTKLTPLILASIVLFSSVSYFLTNNKK
jgi:hypothetical protein